MSDKDDKYWTGNLSSVGKYTEQKYPIILEMEKIFKGQTKKCKIKDFFTPDEPKKSDGMEEYTPFFEKFQISTENTKTSKAKKSRLEFGFKIQNENPKLFFHNQHYLNENRKKKTSSYRIRLL